MNRCGPGEPSTRQKFRTGAGPALAAVFLLCFSSPASPAAGFEDLGFQLDEVRGLLREKRFFAALQDLKFIAEQIQDLRLEETRFLFPEPPEGWTAAPAMRTSREGDLWSRRLESRRTYTPEENGGKVEVVFDFYSPLIPSVSMSFNPLFLTGDPRVKIVKLAGEPVRLQFNPDTGEGELSLILENRVLVAISGRGIVTETVLKDFAGRLNLPALRGFTLP